MHHVSVRSIDRELFSFNVPSSALVDAWNRCEEKLHDRLCPTIVIDGRHYTQRREFFDMVNTVNECSIRMGGSRIF